ncbi:MAG: anhydro-N-acetylmuramic acid kinase [Oscillospiraceae bacterium]|nr:anhydro-N-acetylmuramic acid kinase [Oscillospiraceae bacterium]
MDYAIGLISGTSLDGCDAALIEIDGKEVRLAAFITVPMPESLRAKILDCCDIARSNVRLICSVNVEIGYWFAKAAMAVCEQAGIAPAHVACIGSHGQTVYHIPEDEGEFLASTLQLGEPSVIAYQTGIPVVSSMRAMDMAAGGRGAPLVPYAEYLLYRGETPRALQNLGGIGNVTVLKENAELSDVFAFDTGPANMIIDALAKRFFGVEFDDGGKIAATGAVDEALLAEWMAIPYVSAPPPKATGRELYGAQFVESALAARPDIRPEDWLATATRYTAAAIELNYRMYVFPRCRVKEVILSGGGAHNETMRREIARALPECEILTQEDLARARGAGSSKYNSDAKEAVAFAMLGYETMHGRPGNVPGATGARGQVILGNITPAPYGG